MANSLSQILKKKQLAPQPDAAPDETNPDEQSDSDPSQPASSPAPFPGAVPAAASGEVAPEEADTGDESEQSDAGEANPSAAASYDQETSPESEYEAEPGDSGKTNTSTDNGDESKLNTQDMQDPNALAKKMRSSQSYVQQLQELADNPKYQAQVPPQTRQDLSDAINRAQQMYNEKTNRNDWLDIAQTLTRSVAQFAAAQGAHPGQNMSLSFQPGIDYNARNEQAYRAMEGQIGGAKSLAEVTRQNALDQSDVANKEYAKKAGALTEGAKIAEQGERDTNQFNRSMMQEEARFKREQLRDALRDKHADSREQRQTDLLNAKDLDQQEKGLTTKLQAAQTLSNNMASDSDLSSKGKEKLAEQYGALAGKADIDPAQLADIAEKSKSGGIGGFFQSEDPAVKQKLMRDQIVAPIKNLLDQVRANKQKLLNKPGQPNTPPANGSPPSPAPAGQSAPSTDNMITVKAPNGALGHIPQSQVEAAKAKGFTVVQ